MSHKFIVKLYSVIVEVKMTVVPISLANVFSYFLAAFIFILFVVFLLLIVLTAHGVVDFYVDI